MSAWCHISHIWHWEGECFIMATQRSLSQLTCEGLRLCLRTIKLSTTGNKATLVQRLLEHEDSHDPEHQQTDDSSSGSSDDRELGDRALTDGPSGRRYSRGLRGCRHSQGPSGLGRLVGSGSPLHSKECGDHSSSVLSSDHGRSGGPRDSECPPKDPVVVDAPGGVTIRLALPLQMRSSSSHAGNADPADAGLRPSSTPACIRKRRNTRRTVDAGQPRVPAFQHQQGIRFAHMIDVHQLGNRTVRLPLPSFPFLRMVKPHLFSTAPGPRMPMTAIVTGGV